MADAPTIRTAWALKVDIRKIGTNIVVSSFHWWIPLKENISIKMMMGDSLYRMQHMLAIIPMLAMIPITYTLTKSSSDNK